MTVFYELTPIQKELSVMIHEALRNLINPALTPQDRLSLAREIATKKHRGYKKQLTRALVDNGIQTGMIDCDYIPFFLCRLYGIAAR